MALFRSRSRYGRLIALATILAGLYYISTPERSPSSFSISASSMLQWPQKSYYPSFEESDRPRAKLPTPPLPTKHKTRNGRPPKYGAGAGARGSKSKPQSPQATSEKVDSPSHAQKANTASHTEPRPDTHGRQPQPPLPPPPGLQLPDSPDFYDPLEHQFNSWKPADYIPRPQSAYKPQAPPDESHSHDIPDPFPLLSRHPPPSLAELNLPSAPRHDKSGPETPLLIGFTRNWPQLLQCVVSYLAAGWPAEDIYVVENTGVMYSNRDGKLGLQNPFYLNHTQLRMLGVGVIVTPTLLTFAQLQNFYTWTALERSWTDFFWSHQDLLVFSDPPSSSPSPNTTLHARASAVLSYLRRPAVPKKWANHFFAYDHLTLVHRDAVLEVGGWDTHIPYYATDCDMYDRLMWRGYWQGETRVGVILDVGSVLDDVGALLGIAGVRGSFRGDPGPGMGDEEGGDDGEGRDDGDAKMEGDGEGQKVVGKGRRTVKKERVKEIAYSKPGEEDRRKEIDKQGETWEHLVELGRRMEALKYTDGGGWRNSWQLRQSGGKGEPFYRDPEGFEIGLRMIIDIGRSVFAEKWGHRGCDIAQIGLTEEDAWRVERDWDPETEGGGSEGNEW